MEKLRVGIIGAGRISDLHALEYLANPRAEIVAVADMVAENAQTRGRAWGVPAHAIFTNYHDLLALPEVDLVEILLPHHLHYQAVLDAAQAGKHVSVQKPMALSVEQADAMIAATQRAGVMFKVFENFIFYPPVQRAKALVDAGEIGEPLSIRIKSNAATSPNAWQVPLAAQIWRFDPAQNGGGPLVFDDGHHKFALAWHFMGQAEAVHAWIGATEVFPGAILDSPSIISWKFANGGVGALEVVYSPELVLDTQHYAQDDRIEITGAKGVIWVTRGHGKMLDAPPVVLYRDRQTRTFSDMPVGWEHSFINSTRHMIDAYFAGAAPSLTGEQGREVLRFALAAQESARLGQAVTLAKG
ncbi:MAG TPA: Gfo/Idh/MocA family oxidoreductase [Chloroflexi bacterium]|nr:Gfo/Idh/MocA family oxidoreductase [Chloroflexota bacterium]